MVSATCFASFLASFLLVVTSTLPIPDCVPDSCVRSTARGIDAEIADAQQRRPTVHVDIGRVSRDTA
jgi:hypothetical protein